MLRLRLVGDFVDGVVAGDFLVWLFTIRFSIRLATVVGHAHCHQPGRRLAAAIARSVVITRKPILVAADETRHGYPR